MPVLGCPVSPRVARRGAPEPAGHWGAVSRCPALGVVFEENALGPRWACALPAPAPVTCLTCQRDLTIRKRVLQFLFPVPLVFFQDITNSDVENCCKILLQNSEI